MIREPLAQDQPLKATGPKIPKQWRRWLWIGLIALLMLIGIVLIARNWLSSTHAVSSERLRIAQVTRGTFIRDVAVNGRIVAAVSPTLYAPVQSTVSLKIQAGAPVNKGDVLLELESPELTNELQREQSTLQQLQGEADNAAIDAQKSRLDAQREVDEANISLQAAERELERSQRAFDAGVIAQVELMRSKDALDTANIRLKNAQSSARLNTQSANFDVQTKQQQAQRQRLLTEDLLRRVDELKVRSPITGIIGTVSVADRANVAINTALLTVVDLSQLEVELSVAESYAEDLGIGMPVEVNIGGNTVTGKLSAISPEVVSNQVLVRVAFQNQQPAGLRQNQRVSARILMDERSDVLQVARGSFIDQNSGGSIYVVRDGMATRQPVRLGAASVSNVEILDGLNPGDQVVISGADHFNDAEQVRIGR